MDESVEVGDDVRVEVVDHIDGVARGDAFVLLNLGNDGLAEFVEEQLALQVVVVVGEFDQFVLDALVLLHHQLVQVLLDIVGHLCHVLAVFQL